MRDWKVLVTSGPTSVPIDDVRVITNRSTGEMGRLIVAALVRNGSRVTLLEGNVTTTQPLPRGVDRRTFFFFSELDGLLRKELRKKYDAVIHAAAVSDFVPKNPWKGKVPSSGKRVLEIVPARKLVNEIKRSSSTILAGFKLETILETEAVRKKIKPLFRDAGCDLVVVNSVSDGRYRAFVVGKDGKISRTVTTKKEIVEILINEIEESVNVMRQMSDV